MILDIVFAKLDIILHNSMFYSCQATNLAGSGQQATPVTVRHTGRKDFFENFLIYIDLLSHLKTQCENKKTISSKKLIFELMGM